MAEGKADIIDIASRIGKTDSDVAPKIDVRATTGLQEGPVGPNIRPEGFLSKARRAFSRAFRQNRYE